MEIKTQELPDEQLAEAAQNGHLDSFAALYERYHSSMVALAYSVLADKHLAEDAAQEVFVIACRDLLNLKRRDKFGAWLAGICRNVARGILREKGKTIASDLWNTTENHDSQQQHLDTVRQAIWKLSSAERELIVLRYYDGFSQARISKVLDISSSAVNGRLVRAKRKIAQYLKQNGFVGDNYETL